MPGKSSGSETLHYRLNTGPAQQFLAVDTAIESQFQVRPEVAEAKTWRTSCRLSLLLYYFFYKYNNLTPTKLQQFVFVKSRFLPLVLYKRRSEVNG